MINRLLLFVLLFFIGGMLSAQVLWEVPADRSAKLSSESFTTEGRIAGGELYQTNCKSCHGDPGKNNVIKLVPIPPDPVSVQMQQNSDGALHYKISEGRVTMPSFKNILSSAEIWNVIAFLRGFNKDYQQQLAVKPTFGGEVFDKVNLEIVWIATQNSVQTRLTGLKGTVVKPLAGLEVKLFVKRYFGNLVVDKPVDTDTEGRAIFKFPKDLPGDASGKVQLVAQLSNEEFFGLIKSETEMMIGLPNSRPPLNEPRALWNIVQKTPVWLLLTYLAVVLGVWGCIFLVMMQLRAIFKLGE